MAHFIRFLLYTLLFLRLRCVVQLQGQEEAAYVVLCKYLSAYVLWQIIYK